MQRPMPPHGAPCKPPGGAPYSRPRHPWSTGPMPSPSGKPAAMAPVT